MNKAKKWVLTVVLSILWGGLVGFVVGITLEDSKFVTPILVVIGNALIISKIWRASEATSIDEIKKSYSERGGDVTPDIQECCDEHDERMRISRLYDQRQATKKQDETDVR